MYKNNPTGINWKYNRFTEIENKYADRLVRKFDFTDYNPPAMTFCISLSSACNLNCSYCFSKTKTEKSIDFETIKKYLDTCFRLFPDKEKYYIDLSGKGEPLLFLSTILKIKEYCVEKSNQLNREVDVRFASNGILLTPEVAKILEKHDIWCVGVSLDGNQEINDLYRKTNTGEPTYQKIIANVNNIEHHELYGCAVTLTKNVFSLVDSLKELSKTFKTVGYKPARTCDEAIDQETIGAWCIEYDKLAEFLLDEAIKLNNLSYIKVLLNGDDYFGKFIRRCFYDEYTPFRCDGGLARFSLDTNGKIYTCAAAYEFDDLCLCDIDHMDKLDRYRQMVFADQIEKDNKCKECDVRNICGGECMVEKKLAHGINDIMCQYKKHLIYLAMWFVDTLKEQNKDAYDELHAFIDDYRHRIQIDEKLAKFLEEHPEYNFVDGKLAYDEQTNQDINPY